MSLIFLSNIRLITLSHPFVLCHLQEVNREDESDIDSDESGADVDDDDDLEDYIGFRPPSLGRVRGKRRRIAKTFISESMPMDRTKRCEDAASAAARELLDAATEAASDASAAASTVSTDSDGGSTRGVAARRACSLLEAAVMYDSPMLLHLTLTLTVASANINNAAVTAAVDAATLPSFFSRKTVNTSDDKSITSLTVPPLTGASFAASPPSLPSAVGSAASASSDALTKYQRNSKHNKYTAMRATVHAEQRSGRVADAKEARRKKALLVKQQQSQAGSDAVAQYSADADPAFARDAVATAPRSQRAKEALSLAAAANEEAWWEHCADYACPLASSVGTGADRAAASGASGSGSTACGWCAVANTFIAAPPSKDTLAVLADYLGSRSVALMWRALARSGNACAARAVATMFYYLDEDNAAATTSSGSVKSDNSIFANAVAPTTFFTTGQPSDISALWSLFSPADALGSPLAGRGGFRFYSSLIRAGHLRAVPGLARVLGVRSASLRDLKCALGLALDAVTRVHAEAARLQRATAADPAAAADAAALESLAAEGRAAADAAELFACWLHSAPCPVQLPNALSVAPLLRAGHVASVARIASLVPHFTAATAATGAPTAAVPLSNRERAAGLEFPNRAAYGATASVAETLVARAFMEFVAAGDAASVLALYSHTGTVNVSTPGGWLRTPLAVAAAGNAVVALVAHSSFLHAHRKVLFVREYGARRSDVAPGRGSLVSPSEPAACGGAGVVYTETERNRDLFVRFLRALTAPPALTDPPDSAVAAIQAALNNKDSCSDLTDNAVAGAAVDGVRRFSAEDDAVLAALFASCAFAGVAPNCPRALATVGHSNVPMLRLLLSLGAHPDYNSLTACPAPNYAALSDQEQSALEASHSSTSMYLGFIPLSARMTPLALAAAAAADPDAVELLLAAGARGPWLSVGPSPKAGLSFDDSTELPQLLTMHAYAQPSTDSVMSIFGAAVAHKRRRWGRQNAHYVEEETLALHDASSQVSASASVSASTSASVSASVSADVRKRMAGASRAAYAAQPDTLSADDWRRCLDILALLVNHAVTSPAAAEHRRLHCPTLPTHLSIADPSASTKAANGKNNALLLPGSQPADGGLPAAPVLTSRNLQLFSTEIYSAALLQLRLGYDHRWLVDAFGHYYTSLFPAKAEMQHVRKVAFLLGAIAGGYPALVRQCFASMKPDLLSPVMYQSSPAPLLHPMEAARGAGWQGERLRESDAVDADNNEYIVAPEADDTLINGIVDKTMDASRVALVTAACRFLGDVSFSLVNRTNNRVLASSDWALAGLLGAGGASTPSRTPRADSMELFSPAALWLTFDADFVYNEGTLLRIALGGRRMQQVRTLLGSSLRLSANSVDPLLRAANDGTQASLILRLIARQKIENDVERDVKALFSGIRLAPLSVARSLMEIFPTLLNSKHLSVNDISVLFRDLQCAKLFIRYVSPARRHALVQLMKDWADSIEWTYHFFQTAIESNSMEEYGHKDAVIKLDMDKLNPGNYSWHVAKATLPFSRYTMEKLPV